MAFSTLTPGGPLKRKKRLCAQSRDRRREKAAQAKAYAAADDAEQGWCSCCGRPGETDHSHHFTQGGHKGLANDQRNWLKLCREHHRLFEDKKAAFAAEFPDCWRKILTAMREVDAGAYARFALKNDHLIPNDLLP